MANIHRMKRHYRRREPKYQLPSGDHVVVAVDLGKWKLGVAIGIVRGQRRVLTHACTIEYDWEPEHNPVEVARYVRAYVNRLLQDAQTLGLPVVWVCEWPQMYPHQRQQHADLEALHAVGHKLAAWSERYQPRQWKGSIRKEPHHRRIEKNLTSHEHTVMPPRSEHDAWDAAGILLYAMARTGPGARTLET